MPVLTKKRWSLGRLAVGVLSAGLLAVGLGAGAATGAVAVAPVNTALPQISGTAEEGQVLTTSDGTWSNTPTSFAYAWMRCNAAGAGCKLIGKATQKTYTLVGADANHTIRSSVTATNADGSGTAQSAQTAAVSRAASGAAPANTSPPTITGTAKVGQVLTAAEGAWSNKPTGFTYAWQRCDADVASCQNIPGATGKTYTVTTAVLGYRLRVTVTAKNAKGSATANSAITAIVAPVVTVRNHRPTITILSARLRRSRHLRALPDL
jgi:hypothetical protein